ncbi:class I SAM-dependent methyltransferase [Bacillus sp. V3-13]|uniref:class I SAM-dependent methyltransferase n=1 Tax=Bacillus sp. V3-13 TaxID=2053728 RepID=UPI000C7876CA|nr:class I SAM-dependent methyltransferase [Bacillus sp. V3-13]PLR78662.1 class I SAM-dependent methyltransferase [Bacillus sp. V3-13]
MQLSPRIYHSFVRQKWITKIYIENKLQQHFDFKDRKVLDFGAGTGANCTLFSPVDYLGIDPDTDRINFAKQLYAQYRFKAFSGNKLPAEDNSFDFVLIISVLHHIPPETIGSYVREFRRILKPKGRIVAIEPCFFEKSPINNWFMRFNDKGDYIQKEEDYLNYFTKENFKCNVLNRFKKCLFYNELYFTALL